MLFRDSVSANCSSVSWLPLFLILKTQEIFQEKLSHYVMRLFACYGFFNSNSC
uniref:Uncharacterized protein n=1 Tax=Arundo donax TaxID=35708 RepID=A0A0A9DT91_ARUDO